MTVFLLHFSYGQNVVNKQESFINNFLVKMQKMEKLNKYVKDSKGYTIDFFNVERYKIVSINNDVAVVDIDTGKGVFCVRIYLNIVNDKTGRYFLQGYKNDDTSFLNPWSKKVWICS